MLVLTLSILLLFAILSLFDLFARCLFFLNKAVPDQAVLGLVLLCRFGRVVDQAKAGRLTASKFVAEPKQGDEILVGNFVGLKGRGSDRSSRGKKGPGYGFSDHILELRLRDIGSVGVNDVYHLRRQYSNVRCSLLMHLQTVCVATEDCE